MSIWLKLQQTLYTKCISEHVFVFCLRFSRRRAQVSCSELSDRAQPTCSADDRSKPRVRHREMPHHWAVCSAWVWTLVRRGDVGTNCSLCCLFVLYSACQNEDDLVFVTLIVTILHYSLPWFTLFIEKCRYLLISQKHNGGSWSHLSSRVFTPPPIKCTESFSACQAIVWNSRS